MNPRLVAFSAAVTLAAGTASALAATPTKYDRPGRAERVSVSSNGAQASYPANYNGSPASSDGDISGDGRRVVFTSLATNLVPGDTNAMADVFLHDRQTGSTVRASVASDGSQALPAVRKDCPGCGSYSGEPVISRDGRYVAFSSDAINLVPGDTNLATDVFVRDTLLHRTVRVSVSTPGEQGNGNSVHPSISADGQYVAFMSTATNLVPGDTNRVGDIFIRDLRRNVTTRVSVASDGTQADSNSENVAISGNGQVVAFASFAENLTPGATASQLAGVAGRIADVYARNLRTGKTVRVSTTSDGSPSSFSAFPSCLLLCGQDLRGPHAISDDGRYVEFMSNATNLVPNDSNFSLTHQGDGADVFVKDLATGRTERASVDSYGHEKVDGSDGGAISSSGRFVGYETLGLHCDAPVSLLPKTPVDTDGLCYFADAYQEPFTGASLQTQDKSSYVYDRLTGTMDTVTRPIAGEQPKSGACSSLDATIGRAANFSRSLALSSDGRFDLLISSLQNLVAGDTNNRCDFIVRDRGPALGVGGLTGMQPPSQPAPPGCGLPVCPPLPVGAGLQQARVIPRQGLQDLFIRWDVSRMAPVTGVPGGGLLYELRFTNDDQHFAVRAQRIPGPDFDSAGGACFGLFRQTSAGLWTKVAALKGGYGTMGDSIVTAVPLSLLGGRAQLTDVTAYTALGSYLSGPTKVLDSLRLSR